MAKMTGLIKGLRDMWCSWAIIISIYVIWYDIIFYNTTLCDNIQLLAFVEVNASFYGP